MFLNYKEEAIIGAFLEVAEDYCFEDLELTWSNGGKIIGNYVSNFEDSCGKKGEEGKMEAMGFEIGPEMMSMMGGFTVLRLFTLMGGMMDVKFTKEQLLDLNAKLNKIKRPKKK